MLCSQCKVITNSLQQKNDAGGGVCTLTLLLKEALEKAKRDAKVLKTSFLPPLRKGHAVEAIASSQLSCI